MIRTFELFPLMIMACVVFCPAETRDDSTVSNQTGYQSFERHHVFGTLRTLRAENTVVSFQMFPAESRAPASSAKSSASAIPNHQKQDPPQLILLTSTNWRPLTRSEKFAFFWTDLLRWETHASLALDSGITYANGTRSYLGSGGKKYLRIYGLDAADDETFAFFNAFFFPWIFHQDPRYIPLGHGRTGERIKYALSRVIMTRNDAGHEEFNKSTILGTIVATSVSNSYYSSCGADVSVGGNFADIGVNLASEAGFNVLKELWPEVARKLKINLWIRSQVTNLIRDKIHVR